MLILIPYLWLLGRLVFLFTLERLSALGGKQHLKRARPQLLFSFSSFLLGSVSRILPPSPLAAELLCLVSDDRESS